MKGSLHSFTIVSTILFLLACASACDGYKYRGMDGEQALAHANTLPLEQAYAFYIETYRGVSPPMLDVASTFRRFGLRGHEYLATRATKARDAEEFEAIVQAMMLNNVNCPPHLQAALKAKASELAAGVSYVGNAC